MYGCHSRRGSSLRSRVGDKRVPVVHCGGGAGEDSVGGAGVVGVGKSLEIGVRSFPLMWSGGKPTAVVRRGRRREEIRTNYSGMWDHIMGELVCLFCFLSVTNLTAVVFVALLLLSVAFSCSSAW